MYIYKIYKDKNQLNRDIELNRLYKDYIFCLNNRLYKIIDDNNNYIKICYFEYANDFDKNQIESMCNLVYDKDDIIKITGVYSKV